jgi:putative endonuclease
MNDKIFCVYIMTNGHNTVLYTGMTSYLPGRVWQHKSKVVEGFTKRYSASKLVYYEVHPTALSAITREKQIKSWSRARKEELIRQFNPTWHDLSDQL